ncbi:MAG: GAF domain-containing protein [Ferrovibrio sp.]|uniref:histidine kinase dimerization/phosphoacceptor domain -containing protein n=1 Tax=Ferrovibrio sp. TaxID=1917215 RepID=UPI00262B8A26|nr:histidine kinase dimerization/phosphoacceptor domain -containing protein [Ferrovibrio sp.]MCW0235412.1 GAF domain-containing protein [Ferrovibrio sp.]
MMSSLTRLFSGPQAEEARMAAVRGYAVLDTPPDTAFDHITSLAADLFGTPIALISIVDEDRVWFKSRHGMPLEQIGRDAGLCASAILQKQPWLLADAAGDPRAQAHPLVTGDFGLRFYLGIPLSAPDGSNLGTLCVMDRKPRSVTRRQMAGMHSLAALAMTLLDLHKTARQADAALAQAAADKDKALRLAHMMANEIDHRVMNSLQLVAGLLSMQSRMPSDDDVPTQLKQAAGRVSAIARVHQHIYLSEGIEHADVGQYLQRVCDDLSVMLEAGNRGSIAVSGAEVKLPTARIVAIGLIINELVTNAIKYGEGKVTVRFADTETGYTLSVSDEGDGPPPDEILKPARGFGMKVITSLVQQLRGALSIGRQDDGTGTRITIAFPREIALPHMP